VEPTRRGDPESPLCWTTCSTRKLAAELTAAGHRIGPDTMARLRACQDVCVSESVNGWAFLRG
jgi:DDE family transposase